MADHSSWKFYTLLSTLLAPIHDKLNAMMVVTLSCRLVTWFLKGQTTKMGDFSYFFDMV